MKNLRARLCLVASLAFVGCYAYLIEYYPTEARADPDPGPSDYYAEWAELVEQYGDKYAIVLNPIEGEMHVFLFDTEAAMAAWKVQYAATCNCEPSIAYEGPMVSVPFGYGMFRASRPRLTTYVFCGGAEG